MNYKEALDYIHSTYKFGSKLGLENIGFLLNLLGNPQKNLKFIHVAGTNGKGSTCSMLSYVLTEAGYKTGLFISPYLVDFRERIQLNNQLISEDDLVNAVACVKAATERMVKEGKNHPTEFEIVTAVAMVYYNIQKADIVILEVGMGGRLDATNIIDKPELCIITSISMDHSEYLGHTLEEIAFEKASIIKYGCPVVVYPQKDSVHNVIRQFAVNKLSRLYAVNPKDIEIINYGPWGQKLKYNNSASSLNISSFELSLIGVHQSLNALTVLKALEILIDIGYNITNHHIVSSLQKVRFMGRLEILSKNPLIIIDGAHNAEGIETLTHNLKTYFSNYEIHLFFGMLSDKEMSSQLSDLALLCKEIITVTPDNPRAKPATETAAMFENWTDAPIYACDNLEESLSHIGLGENVINIYCGSLYMIGAARNLILNRYIQS